MMRLRLRQDLAQGWRLEQLVMASPKLIAFVTFLYTGLRAAMGAGYSRMNQLTIIQTTQVINLLTIGLVNVV